MIIVKADNNGLKKAREILKKGGVIIYPTDTAYALGGNFRSKTVQDKILKIKNRKDTRFTLICSSLYQVQNNFKIRGELLRLARKYWPGPLSLAINDKYSFRVPNQKIARKLAAGLFPLIATSANITGGKEMYDSKDLIDFFRNKKNQPDLLIDYGKIRKVKPSTIIKEKGGELVVIRKGPIKL